jgi:hypothetical protein
LEQPVTKRIRPINVALVLALMMLACVFYVRQQRVAKLQAALAEYRSHAHIKIIEWLQEPNRVMWTEGATLADVIERIRHSATPLPKGVPIVVDPAGLEEAGQSMDSPVKAPRQNGYLLLQEKLRVALEPLGLDFDVKNDSIVITSRHRVNESADDAGEPARSPGP